MPVDANVVLQASVTKTATFSGSALKLPGGTPRRGLKARILYSAASNASGSNTAQFSIDVSYDNASTWLSNLFQAQLITLSTTVQSGEVFVPFDISPTSVVNGTQIRLTVTIAGAGSTPTITYQGDLVLTRP
jgi:hypothetical protein